MLAVNESVKKKDMTDILAELKENHQFVPKRRYKKEGLQNLAKEFGMTLEFEVDDDVIPGWCNRPKGMLQVLYERRLIDKNNLDQYSKNGKKKQLGDDGLIKDQYKKYVLIDMMANCEDFKNQKNAMEELCDELSSIGSQNCNIDVAKISL